MKPRGPRLEVSRLDCVSRGCVYCRTYLWRNVVSLGVLMLLLVAMAHVPETDPTLMLFLTALTGRANLVQANPHTYLTMEKRRPRGRWLRPCAHC